jgi:hypothetical protein
MEIGAHMKQVYKITNLKNLKSYIGISICAEQNHMDRFEKHMTGKGGVWIKKDLETGMATRNDFVIEVLEEGDHPDEYYKIQEIYYIEQFDTLYPRGYNGNKGNYIVMTEEIIKKALETRRRNFEAGLHKPSGKKGHAIYRYPDGQIKHLAVDHEDVVNGIVKHINYNPNSKGRRISQVKAEQRLKNNGLTDAEVAAMPFFKRFGQRMVNDPNFWNGRKKLSERHARKEFTQAELEQYALRSDRVKEEWSHLDRDSRLQRTQSGLSVMNAAVTCEHCGTTTNKGNYKRWHGSKCKNKPQQQ